MSGSSGGGGGGDVDAPVVDCADLIIETQLTSPKAGVIKDISVGDLLDVATASQGGTVTVIVLHAGKLGGGITSSDMNRLRECLKKGWKYRAKVTKKNGAQVRVRIEAV